MLLVVVYVRAIKTKVGQKLVPCARGVVVSDLTMLFRGVLWKDIGTLGCKTIECLEPSGLFFGNLEDKSAERNANSA